jgi:hypothetical protein
MCFTSRCSLVRIGIVGWCIAGILMFSACSKDKSQSDSADADKRPASPGGAFAPGESGKTTAIGRALDSARSIAATQLTAGQLGKLYTPQLQALQSGLSQIQGAAAANPSLLTGDAGAAYQELRALVPELAEMLNALRNHDPDGPVDITAKLQAGFAKASELYAKLTGHALTAPPPQ